MNHCVQPKRLGKSRWRRTSIGLGVASDCSLFSESSRSSSSVFVVERMTWVGEVDHICNRQTYIPYVAYTTEICAECSRECPNYGQNRVKWQSPAIRTSNRLYSRSYASPAAIFLLLSCSIRQYVLPGTELKSSSVHQGDVLVRG